MISFRPAALGDHPTIAGFQIDMAWETEKLKLDPAICSKGVRSVFENPNLGKYFVAEEAGMVLGSLLLTHEWSDWRAGMVWWIQSVYIAPNSRGKKIFSAFYGYIKQMAEADPNCRGLRLYVDRTNLLAQEIYKKIGMNGDHYRLFEWMKNP